MCRHTHQYFVQEAREDKDHDAREAIAETAANEREINMPAHEMIDGFVPGAPVIAHRRAVPPVGVELAVAEAHDFRQGVEGGLEDREEAGQPDDEGDGGEFHEPLEDGGDVHRLKLVERIAEDGRGVLRAGEPDEHAEAEAFGDAFDDEEPADGGGSRVYRLVDEGGGPPEVGEVADGDVAGVGAMGVDLWEGGGCLGEEVGVAEIAIGEGVGADFEPDDDGVDLADGAEKGVVDVIVNGVGGDEEAKCGVDAVSPGYDVPGYLEGTGVLERVFDGGGGGGGGGAFETAESAFGVLGGTEFDDVGDKEVAWDEGVEEGAEEDVVTAIVVAANTDENAILEICNETGT